MFEILLINLAQLGVGGVLTQETVPSIQMLEIRWKQISSP